MIDQLFITISGIHN